MKIGILYFSATGITKEYAKFIGNEIERTGEVVELINIFKKENRIVNISKYDFCIFGFPVYNGRLPTVAESWLETIDGENKRCSMFFTYGGRALEWAHQVGYYLLQKSKFKVVLSAEFLGKHSFNVGKGWRLAEDRPNTEDYQIAKEFSLLSRDRFLNDDIHWTFDLKDFIFESQDYQIKLPDPFTIFLPHRKRQECRMCFRCENECPVDAFSATTGIATNGVCILCMYCVKICPDQVIQIGNLTEIFKKFANRHNLAPEVVHRKKSKIIL
jgi:flavodoxin/NAD-dependent dihydropyrimidine dehydrogenase PreA subunit